MVTVTVDLDPRIYEALKVIAGAFSLTVEELVVCGARGEVEGFLSNPEQYTTALAEETAAHVKQILDEP